MCYSALTFHILDVHIVAKCCKVNNMCCLDYHLKAVDVSAEGGRQNGM